MNLDQLQALLAAEWDRPSARQALEICKDHEILGIGGRRITIAGEEGFVYKLAWREAGILDNEIEWRVWQSAPDDLRDYLCRSHDLTLSGISKQDRCLPISAEALPDGGFQIMKSLARWGISDVSANLALIGENVVCYDYCVIRVDLFRDLFPQFR